jgi:hypothetical protein
MYCMNIWTSIRVLTALICGVSVTFLPQYTLICGTAEFFPHKTYVCCDSSFVKLQLLLKQVYGHLIRKIHFN